MFTRDDLGLKFCVGKGVELGPGLRPTRVARGSSLAFVDKRPPEALKTYFGSSHVVTGERLDAYERGSLDFLIAHHVLEHCSSVIEELTTWISYLKDDGVLYLSVPDKQHCADRPRLETPPTHFVFDYLMGIDDSSFESREHIYSFLWGWSEDGALAGKTKQEASNLVFNAVYSPTNDLHWHVFTAATLKFVVETAARLSGRTALIRHVDSGHHQGPEHRIVAVLAKAKQTDETVSRLTALRNELAPFVTTFCLEALDGQPLHCLSEVDKGKIFVAEAGKARWVREPQTLVDRGIAGVPPVYMEFGRARSSSIGTDVASLTFALSQGRQQAVQGRVRLSDGVGLEISPGAAPLINKTDGQVCYCDKVGSEFWREVYGSANNVDVDVVMGSKRLDEVFPENSFDYVVSSHVIEHIPDFIGFFISAQRILKPKGDLVMLVPDKRFTFDVLRKPSTVDQIERAHELCFTHPSREMIYDFYCNIDHAATAEALWKGTHKPKPTYSQSAVDDIMKTVKCEESDLHCWVFTPDDMRQLLEHVFRSHAHHLKVIDISDTPIGGNEFVVHLRKQARHQEAAGQGR